MNQESWHYEQFIVLYNTLAEIRGGWHFEADGRAPEALESRYLASPEAFPTLEAFAEGLFIWEQRINL